MDMPDDDWFAHPAGSPEDHPTAGTRTSSKPQSTTEALVLDEDRAAAAVDQVMPGVSTGALLEAMESPAVFSEIARGDLYVQMARMRAMAAGLTPSLQMEYAKFLSKMGQVDQPAGSDGAAFSRVPAIHIDLGGGQSLSIGAAQEKDITPVEGG